MTPHIFKVLLMAIVAACLSSCAQLFFYPTRQLERTPNDIGLRYQDVYFESSDGTRLHGWYLPAAVEERSAVLATIVHLHGNAENMSTHIGAVHWLPQHGYDVFLFDYREIVQDKLAENWFTWPFQMPVSWLFPNDNSPLKVIDRISPLPLLIVHAAGDPIVPVQHARRLFAAAREPKALWILPQDKHTSLTGYEDNRRRLLHYLNSLVRTDN